MAAVIRSVIGNEARLISMSQGLDGEDYNDNYAFAMAEGTPDRLVAWQGFNNTEFLSGGAVLDSPAVLGVLHRAGVRKATRNSTQSAGATGGNEMRGTLALKIGFFKNSNSNLSAIFDTSALMLHRETTDAERDSLIAWMRTNLGI